jgi:hypothetical protein
MQKFKLLWSLVKPLLASVGITKPADVNSKVIDPIKELMGTMAEMEAKQAASLAEISQSIGVLAARERDLEDDLIKAAQVKESLEELLS